MKAIQFALGFFLFVTFFASNSMAQLQRSFVSGLGNDGNPCTRTAPCRTFGTAIGQTNAAGEVVVLDSAGYSAFSINKSVSIIAQPGVYAGISVFSGDGIDINAGVSDTVILRGLTVNNQGGSNLTNGIVYNTGNTVHIESCIVSGFNNGRGIFFNGTGRLEVKDSISRGNDIGIVIQPPPSEVAVATIDNVRMETGIFGLMAKDHAIVTVRNSVASGNTADGFSASSVAGFPAELDIESCVSSGNSTGISVMTNSGAGATARFSNCIVTSNELGLFNNGSPALLLSRGNNTVEANDTNTMGTIGSYSAK
jgi:hypothetical protein